MSEHVYAVIGSNCFTGSHIVDELRANPANEVIGISRSPEYKQVLLPYKRRGERGFRFCQVDLAKEPERLISVLDEFEPATVINVAALSEVGLSNFQPVEYFQTNCLGTVQLCNQLRTRKYLKRYVHISSAEVYGSCDTALEETAALNPSTPYAVSKAAADMYLMTLFRNFRFPVNLIRSTNVYGARQQLYKIIPRSILYLRTGKKIELHGGGRAVKTWVHIRDIARGVRQVIERGKPGETYHFSAENSFSIAELVKRICQNLGLDFEEWTVATPERLGQDARYLLNYAKAGKELGWNPEVSFEQGLTEVVSWMDEAWEEIVNEPQVYVHKV